jgi:endo-alpha-1,4-polygalactosaminidase (GH114 family)
MNRKKNIKTGMLVAATMGVALALMSWIPNPMGSVSDFKQNSPWIPKGGYTIAELNAKVEEYYGDPDDVSDVARARKMQALIMELTIKAKTRNPNFQVIPQDTWEYAHIDGNANNEYDRNVINLLDGWGIENFSATTVTRLANLTMVGIKGTANTNGSTVQVVADNQKIAADNNILWHPRLSAEVYQSPGIGNPGYMPIYSPSSNSYNIIHDPIPAGVAHTVNSNNVYSMMDAKNHLYMISSGKYSNWPDWETNPASRLDITKTPGYLVPFAGGRFKPTGTAEVVAQAIADHGTEWDFFWVAKGYTQNEGRKAYIEELAASEWDAFYIDAHYSDGGALTKEEVEKLKWKPQGGRRQVIAYLSIGTTELYRWYADPVMVNSSPRSFLHGTVENDTFIPARERFRNVGIPNWMLWSAYSGQYADEATPIWWHPEWRDIIVRGGSPYKNPKYNHSQFADGRSSIDKIVDMGFDGVYLDNVSRATSSGAKWTALQAYNNAHPRWYLEP